MRPAGARSPRGFAALRGERTHVARAVTRRFWDGEWLRIGCVTLLVVVFALSRRRRRARARESARGGVVDAARALGDAFATHARGFVGGEETAAASARAFGALAARARASEDGDEAFVEAFARGAMDARARWGERGVGTSGWDAEGEGESVAAAAGDARARRDGGSRGEKIDLGARLAGEAPSGLVTPPNGVGAVGRRRSPRPSTSSSVTTSMCEEDRALLREELEVRKLEVRSMATSNALSYMALMQKYASNALRAEGNKIAAENHAETKAEREERRNDRAVDRFNRMTCDALAMGLVVTCATTLSLGWREIARGYERWSETCAYDVSRGTSSLVALLTHSVAHARCVAAEGIRGVLGLVAIAVVATMLTRFGLSRRFRAAPMFVLAVVLFAGVGSVGQRAVRALNGDHVSWLLAWRLYVTTIACFVVSAPSVVRAGGVADRAAFRWAYYAALGVAAPALIARVAFAPLPSAFLTSILHRSARSTAAYYYV